MKRVGLTIALATVLMGAAAIHAAGGFATQEMGGHMAMTTLRPKQPGDQARADAVVVAARKAAERYLDYRKAVADGYEIFMPDQKQQVYHFVRESAYSEAEAHFDPSQPGALLYEKDGKGGYKLVGVMYTAAFGASEQELDRRIPLSIAQWHEHLNLCVPLNPHGDWLIGDPRFGLSGSITTKAACDAAGGRFRTHLSGWMTHVYPFESDPAKVWQAGMDRDDGMPGMKM